MRSRPPAAEPDARAFFAGPLPRIFAHRGLALDSPENTLLAFQLALAAGATHLETDVHASRDGVAVICHDPDLTRLLGRQSTIDSFTIGELRRMELGSGQGFVSLQETLAALPDARFNIDVKSDAAVGPTVEAIRRAGATDRVLVTSFSEDRRRRLVAALPGVASSASTRRGAFAVLGSALRIPALARFAVRGLAAVQVPERRGAVRVVTRRFIRSMHDAGVEVHVWTINDPAEMRRLFDLGADGIVTDRSDLARAVVASSL